MQRSLFSTRWSLPVVIGLAAAVLVALVLVGLVVVVGAGGEDDAARAGSAEPRRAWCPDGARSVVELAGLHTEQYRRTDLAPESGFDARGATWRRAGDWPIHLEGGPGLCWRGGEVQGGFSDETSWERLHDSGAFNLFAPEATIEGLRVHNYGDGIRVLDGAADFTLLDVHLSFIRDDCIENDDVYGGTVRRAFLDGCYVAFSARPWQDDFQGDGRDRTWSIVDSLVRLQPMPTVYRGDAPGHGGFFKWDAHGRAPRLHLEGNIFRADQDSNHTTMGIPPDTLVHCRDNIMVWLGDGAYPEPLPDCFRITTDRRVWDDAVAAWRAAHDAS